MKKEEDKKKPKSEKKPLVHKKKPKDDKKKPDNSDFGSDFDDKPKVETLSDIFKDKSEQFSDDESVMSLDEMKRKVQKPDESDKIDKFWGDVEDFGAD